MKWQVHWHHKVKKDIKQLRLNDVQLARLRENIERVTQNPLPKALGGYGEPLAGDPKGLLKFRFDDNYRVVYRLIEQEGVMRIMIIGLRKDKIVYKDLIKRV